MSDFRLNKEIYGKKSINTAVGDYAGIAEIRVEEDPDYWIIYLKDCLYDEELTKHEFENYLLGIEATIGLKNVDL